MNQESDYSPGLKGVVAGETSLALVDGERGRLHYRGYPIGELVEQGTFAQVAELLWSGEWPSSPVDLPCADLPARVVDSLAQLPVATAPMDALRTAVSVWGAEAGTAWPPTVSQARQLTSMAPSALAAFARLRQGDEPIEPDPSLGLVAGFLYQMTGARPEESAVRALDAYFVVAAEHGFNASTFTARVITSTHSDMASALVGAIGALKGPWHGGAPSEVVDQLHQMGTVDQAEGWIRRTLESGERLMGFGHRVYRAYDPRATALRGVAEGLAEVADWLEKAVAVEEIALRLLAEHKPELTLKTNVEYYTAAVLQGVSIPPEFFPATFALARHAGWTAHCLEQAEADVLIRPAGRYVGPEERHLPA